MTTKKVLMIGLDPAVVDYSRWPGLTAEKLRSSLRVVVAFGWSHAHGLGDGDHGRPVGEVGRP